MKRIISLLLIALAWSSPQAKTVEMPWYGGTNTNTIDISAVELTDTATILSIHIRYRPGWWVKFAKETALKAGDDSYGLKWADGIVPDQEFYLPESGEATVRLAFEPVPVDAPSITLTENAPSGFCIWDIDLTGLKHDGMLPEGLPAEVAEGKGAPDPGLDHGETSLTFHLLGPAEATDAEYRAILNTTIGDQLAHKLIFDPKTMQTEPWKFDQYGIAELITVCDGRGLDNFSFTIAPGEKLDIYIDPSASGQYSRFLHRRNPGDQFPELRGTYLNGHRTPQEREAHPYIAIMRKWDTSDDDTPAYKMTADEYVSRTLKNYYIYNYKIDGLNAPDSVKEILRKRAALKSMSRISNFDSYVKSTYNEAHDITDWHLTPPYDSVPHLEPMHYLTVAKAFDLGSDKYDYLYTNPDYDLAADIDWEYFGLESPRLKAIRVASKLMSKAESGEIDEYDQQRIDECGLPLYSAAVRETNAASLKKLEALDLTLARQMPALPAEEALKAITAEHAGKVVIIDVWNTWCGPCQNAIAQNEPLKSGELADDDLVWIYIADDTSAKVAYYSQIPNIKGIHYRQTRAQYEALRDKYGIDGIPSYILVDRQGNISLRNDLRDHSKFVKTLREELDKK